MEVQLTPKRRVDSYGVPYVIAELGSNHNGDMNTARRLIDEAQRAGADCVKFQSWSKDSIFAKRVYRDNYFLSDDYRHRTDYTLEQIVEKFSISESELLEMKRHADKVGIDCISTPFSNMEADFLVDHLKAPFIKVASMDVNNYPFLEHIASKRLPVVLSTGLSELWELDRAITTLERGGADRIVILHCVSAYPPADSDVNLNSIGTLQRLYPYPVGFSDHTIGVTVPLAAVALGACVIEKHFTLDKAMFGWDHKVSADPEDLRTLCREARRVREALGSTRIRSVESQERKDAFRRSIVAVRDLRKGELVQRDSIDFKRPGTGIAPGDYVHVVGRRLCRDVPADELLQWKDLE